MGGDYSCWMDGLIDRSIECDLYSVGGSFYSSGVSYRMVGIVVRTVGDKPWLVAGFSAGWFCWPGGKGYVVPSISVRSSPDFFSRMNIVS